jgi:hypothetical protein
MRLERAEVHHARVIAEAMRPRDTAEIDAGWGKGPYEVMLEGMAESFYARTMFYELEPLCMYGLAPLMILHGSARFWIVSTAAIDRHPLAFARACKRFLPEMFELCTLLTNYIDVADEPAMRWMKWMGGQCVLPPHTRGGRLFAQFILVDQPKRARTCQRA